MLWDKCMWLINIWFQLSHPRLLVSQNIYLVNMLHCSIFRSVILHRQNKYSPYLKAANFFVAHGEKRCMRTLDVRI